MMGKRGAVLLIVEDDLEDQVLIRRSLNHGEFDDEIHFVENGEKAIDYLFNRNEFSDISKYPFPDILFLDLRMPKIDGFQVLEKIRKNPKYLDLPIYVFTTSNYERDKLKCYDLGANEFVTKPMSYQEFLEQFLILRRKWDKQ
ncbi:MAG: response regulator [Candidatus Cloacimonetes bacterium]|nr:response regulator [Candidatus Cloacimonadota bacterium]